MPAWDSSAPAAFAKPGSFGALDMSAIVSPTAAVPLALKLAEQNATFAVCYATEASLFQGGGAPSVVCGPGDIAQAHTPNEFIEIAELEKCLRFLGRLAEWAQA